MTTLSKFIIGAVLAFILLFIGSSFLETVPAGNVGVKFNKFGDDKGVSTQTLSPGWYFVPPSYAVYTFPTFTQTYTWAAGTEGNDKNESISFQTAQGLTVNADVGITYHIDPSKVSLVFQKYRKGVDEITAVYLRNMVRDALVKRAAEMEVEAVYGKGKAKLLEDVQADVIAEVSTVGIEIEKVYWIGELRLPDNVKNSINAKIQATQMAEQRQNEVAQAKAEAEKEVAKANGDASAKLALATADAKAIQLRGDALRNNPGVAELNAIEKWDGHLPQYQLGGATPFVNIPTGK